MLLITRILVFLAIFCLAGSGSETRAEKKIKVVASFSILGDMVQNVGGDRIEVTTLVGPNGDTHVYQPTPAAAKAVGEANLVVVNGLGFEGWIDRLIKTSGYKGPVVVASKGIKPREMTKEEAEEHGHGGKHGHKFDPHAWHDVRNGLIYIDNIAKGLSAVDPAGAPTYEANAAAYKGKLKELDQWVKTEFAGIPKRNGG